MIRKFSLLTGILFFIINHLTAQTCSIEGVVSDKKTGETIVGVSVYIESLNKATSSDPDGKFKLNEIPPGKHKVTASFLSYETVELADITTQPGQVTSLNIELKESPTLLKEIVVSGTRSMNSELSMLSAQKAALTVVSGVSSQQITRNQDKDASEVVKRIPGISILEDRYIVARGLSQRYNNVWINNSSVPASEADTRSFSFDMIPGSQIENIMIVKSLSPDLPADFSGGFVKVTTKNMPTENSFQVSYGMNFNTETQFHDFKYNKGGKTEFLGFDNGYRSLKSSLPKRLNPSNSEQVNTVTKEGFNNNWEVLTQQPIPDQRLSAALNRKFRTESGKQWGLITSLNYSYTHRTFMDMKNTQYGVYNKRNDEPEPENDYTDDQYVIDSKLR